MLWPQGILDTSVLTQVPEDSAMWGLCFLSPPFTGESGALSSPHFPQDGAGAKGRLHAPGSGFGGSFWVLTTHEEGHTQYLSF